MQARNTALPVLCRQGAVFCFPFPVFWVGGGLVPAGFKDCGGPCLVRIGLCARQLRSAVRPAPAFLPLVNRASAFLATLVVGVSPGAGVPHLEKLADYICPHEVARL